MSDERMADLTPQQFTDADEQAPQPLLESQTRGRERVAAELDDDDLQQSGTSSVVLRSVAEARQHQHRGAVHYTTVVDHRMYALGCVCICSI